MCTLSSCLQNEEPAGIEVLRNAKAELIKAQAQYATAQAAYVSAQVAYQELVNAEKELNNRIKAAEAAYWEAYYQYRAAVEQAKSEQEIAYWEAEMLRQQNEKELIIERHKRALLEAQTATAQAEYNYQVAMDALALASSSLSQAEKEAIAGYRQDIAEVREALKTAQKGIAGAQTDLLDAKYYFDGERILAQYQRRLENLQVAVDLAQAAYDEAKAMDLDAGNSEWQTKVDELEALIEGIDKEIEALVIEAEEQEQRKIPYEEQIAAINARIAEVDRQSEAVQKQIDEMDAWLNENVVTEVTVPETVAASLQSTFDGVLLNKGDVTVKDYYTPGTDELANGVVSWMTSQENNYGTNADHSNGLLNQLIEDVSEYVLDETQLSQFQSWHDGQVSTYTADLETFNDGFTALEAAKKAYLDAAKEYGYDYINDKFAAENMWAAADEALTEIEEAIAAGATVDQVEGFTDKIKVVSAALDKQYAMVGYHDGTFAAFTEGWDKAGLENINMYLDGILHVSDVRAALGTSEPSLTWYVDDSEEDPAKWSYMRAWKEYSVDLYGNTAKPVYYPLTLEDMDGIEFTFTLDKSKLEYTSKHEFTSALDNKIDANEISSVENSRWYRIAKAEAAEAFVTAVTDNQPAYVAVVDDLQASFDAIEAVDNQNKAQKSELEVQKAELANDRLALVDEKDEPQAAIDQIDVEIAALVGENSYSEKVLKASQKEKYADLKEVYEYLIANNKLKIDETDYVANSDDAKKAWAEYLAELLTELEKAENNVATQQTAIENLADQETAQEFLIQHCETILATWQAQYDSLIKEFNYYNEQLTALLDAITGGEDVPEQPENPETPENPGEGGEETPAA